MSNMVMTSIYLTPSQKRAIAQRAKQSHTTVSEEIRTALDRHLQRGHEHAEAELSLLAGEANKALDRMAKKLEEAHASVTELFRQPKRKKT